MLLCYSKLNYFTEAERIFNFKIKSKKSSIDSNWK